MDNAHISESANIKVQNIFHVLNNNICSTNCKYTYITPPKLYAVEIEVTK
jgi:hypothetical protein